MVYRISAIANFKTMITAIFFVIFMLAAMPAQALYIGNPVHGYESGDVAGGLAFSDERVTVFVDYGLSEDGVLEVFLGSIDFGFGVSGSEYGVGYRHRIPKGFDLGEYPVKLGIVALFRIGTVDVFGTDYTYNILNIAFAGAISPVENLNLYAGPLYHRFSDDAAADSKTAALIGAEYWIGEGFNAGLEKHLGLEGDELVLFGALKF